MHSLLDAWFSHNAWPAPSQYVSADISLDDAKQLAERVQHMAITLDLQGLKNHPALQRIASEASLYTQVSGQWQILRPDLVAYTTHAANETNATHTPNTTHTPNAAWVLDFKLSFNPAYVNPDVSTRDASLATAESYAAQLRSYQNALMLKGLASDAYILTLDGQCWALGQGLAAQTTQWQQVSPPWV